MINLRALVLLLLLPVPGLASDILINDVRVFDGVNAGTTQRQRYGSKRTDRDDQRGTRSLPRPIP